MSSPRIGLTLKIDAPVEAVWAVVTDIGSAEVVLSGVDAIELLSDGPYGPGTRWRETRTMFGMKDTMEMEVSESVPPQRTVVLAEVGDVIYRTEFRLRPRRDGDTELSMGFGAQLPPQTGLKGLATTVIGSLGLNAARRSMEQDLLDIANAARTRA